jgi:hypothetical protein
MRHVRKPGTYIKLISELEGTRTQRRSGHRCGHSLKNCFYWAYCSSVCVGFDGLRIRSDCRLFVHGSDSGFHKRRGIC